MTKKLTADQVHALEGYERNFKQATEAAWCSYPGQAGINLMLDIWAALTGHPYPYKPGCPNCLMNLVRDMGTLYFAQKDSVLAEETAAKAGETAAESPAKVSTEPGNATEAAKPGKTTKGKKTAVKRK